MLHVPAVLWGVAWFFTAGLFSISYGSLAGAAAITASAFHGLAPAGPVAVATSGAGTTASVAAAAAVDWANVALRTAAGLAGGGAGREQVLRTLEEVHAGSITSAAVQSLVPALCVLHDVSRRMMVALQACGGLPLLNGAVAISAAAALLGVLTVMAVPLRPYLAPLLPRLVPKGRPDSVTMSILRASGISCMLALLTTLQQMELPIPALRPDAGGAAATAAAAGSPLLVQHRALLYGALAVAGDALLSAWVALASARTVAATLAAERKGPGLVGQASDAHASDAGLSFGAPEGAKCAAASIDGRQQLQEAARRAAPGGHERVPSGAVTEQCRNRDCTCPPAPSFSASRALAAGRFLLDSALLVAVATGALQGEISVGRLVGMLWLAQQVWWPR